MLCTAKAINVPFSIEMIKEHANTTPIEIAHIDDMDISNIRVNHLMIKNNDDERVVLPDFIATNPDIKQFIDLVLMKALTMGWDIDNRYWYLTVDQGIVSNEKTTLREPGWHIDGMQGNEVPVKKNGDFQFIWSNTLMTEFCKQEFNTDQLDPNIHNVFDFLSKQVDEKNIYHYPDGTVILMHCYHVHRSQTLKDRDPILRKFVRLSFTNTPITSVKLTVNEAIKYNYAIHTTTGEIPDNLL